MHYGPKEWRAVMAEIAGVEPPVKTWRHSRKGVITGRIVEETGDFVTIEVTDPSTLHLASRYADPNVHPGDTLVVRKSFLTEVPTEKAGA